MLGLLSCALKRVIIELCQEKSSNHEKHGWNFYAKVVFLQPLLMQKMGLEPTRYCYHRHLKPARLPIPPLLHVNRHMLLYLFPCCLSTIILKKIYNL